MTRVSLAKIPLLFISVAFLSLFPFQAVAAQSDDGPSASGGGSVAAAEPTPEVDTLKAYSPEANYMSLEGCMIHLTYESSGQWLTRSQADGAIDAQIESATR